MIVLVASFDIVVAVVFRFDIDGAVVLQSVQIILRWSVAPRAWTRKSFSYYFLFPVSKKETEDERCQVLTNYKKYRQHTCTYLRTLCIRQSIYTKNQTRIAHSFKLLYFNKKHNEEAHRYQKTQEKDCQKKEQQNNCCTSTPNSDRSVKHFFII